MDKKYITSSNQEANANEVLLEGLKSFPLPNETLNNLSLFMNRISLQNVLLFDELYKKITNTHGIIMEFGTRTGHNLALLSSLRGIHEPFVRSRKIVGFDTFDGFIDSSKKDGKDSKKGDFNVSRNYQSYLENIMSAHEKLSPISHIKKYEIIKGDAVVNVKKYFKDNPETIIALAYFDMNLYEPTKKCLLAIKNRMNKGGIIAFDQINHHDHPGETVAFREVFGNKYAVNRWPISQSMSYIVLN